MGLFDFLRNLGRSNDSESHPHTTEPEERLLTVTRDDAREEIPEARRIGLPQLHGLSIGQLILLNWLNGKTLEAHIPGYFSFQYGINAVQSRQQLIAAGFVHYAPPERALNALKVVDLKEILQDNNQPVSGRKADLIQRITSQINIAAYQHLIPRVLEPSTTGTEILVDGGLLVWAAKQRLAFPIEEFVQFLPADPPYAKYGQSLAHAHFMQYLARRQYSHAWMEARCAQVWAAELEDTSNEVFYFLSAILVDFVTGGSSMGDREDYYFNLPDEASSGFFQSTVLDMVQQKKLAEPFFSDAVKQYIVEIQPFMPDFLHLSPKEIRSIVDEAADLSPHELWQLQTAFMKKRIPSEHLLAPYTFRM